ncbi:gamma-glutamyl-gamma-aminobutyrate hydrolase family protein [Pleionea sp. CnH1-48]|uniref:type 1 glutamine amidotransferase n=1 Tax=Pleionea sp. CnH1-48 TaxID=2954494 RepID=UPI002096837A|nr:gamma-glutamyl-gamma-aminobutyrate hydrolase family protein [Pleionea sp. CnH1-48]
MAKVMVFQHVPYEPLGTLDPLIRAARHRIRYVNFGRDPNEQPSLRGYDGLVVLGGPMNIGQEANYPHLDVEKALIREAIELGIPILGICLGAQLIASSMGADVRQMDEREVGWTELAPTPAGGADKVIQHFGSSEMVFQWHEYTFELPSGAELLVSGQQCHNQAFRLNDNVYGFQFHLEANLPLIQRWLRLPQHLEELGLEQAEARIESIWAQTLYQMDRSLALSHQVFSQFLSLLPAVKAQQVFFHR